MKHMTSSKQQKDMEWERKWGIEKIKIKARKKIFKMAKKGRIKRGECEVCGEKERIHAHHPDYQKPLEIKWLCAKHHKEEHRKMKCKG